MEIATDRLLVRSFRPDDWRDLLAYLALPETYRFEPGEPIDAPRAQALAGERSRGTDFFAVELRSEGRMIGHLSFMPGEPPSPRTRELGYIFDPRYQRRGFATEASRALVEHAFEAWGVERVVASCNPLNLASWRVLEKAGFVRERYLRRHVFFRRDPLGRPLWQDTFVYGRMNAAKPPGPPRCGTTPVEAEDRPRR